ncbi:MAG: LacI family transcriptional regulator [Chloroflexi bacterium]|nr:LacI family transcriptional regulator [Chloroflexota bacterium]
MADQAERSRPTLRDVADRAGVSPITVSRAIRGSAPVHEETKRRIDQAVAELGYVPNEAARQLVRGRANDRVGIMLHNTAHYLWSRVSFAMQADLVRLGYASLLVGTEESQVKEAQQLAHLVGRGVCGIIASPCGLDSPLPAQVRGHALPLVLLNSGPDALHDTVAVDEAGGTYQLTRHLLDQGHRRIALVYRAPTDYTAVERHAGFAAALREAGLPVDRQLIWEGPSGNAEAAIAALLELAEPPTAIVAAASWAAFGVLYALARRQIMVPDEIEVAVFGEMPTFGSLLTHLSYEPVEALAARAVEMLVDRISGYEGPPRRYVQSVRVIERE